MKYSIWLILILLITGCSTSNEGVISGGYSENPDSLESDVPSEEENGNVEEYAEFEGIVAEKSTSEKNRILVVPNMDKQKVLNILDKSNEELRGKLIEEAVFYFVEEDEYEQVEIGTRVKVYYDASKGQLESQPPQRTSKKLEVVMAN